MTKFFMMALVTFGAFAAQAACVEGRTSVFYEYNTKEDHNEMVTRTCVNGSYYDLSDYVYQPKVTCVEGRQSIFWERDNVNDQTNMVTRTCVNGSYFPKQAQGKKYRCVEGTLSSHSEWNNKEDQNDTVVTKCINGKHVEIRRH